MGRQPANIVSSSALEITDGAQQPGCDMAAALASSLGHRHPEIVRAITAACQSHLGSAHDLATATLFTDIGEPFSEFAATSVVPSASEANEWAIRIARAAGGAGVGLRGEALSGDPASGPRYRIITLLGGDHGDTLACRSASGRIADQATDGPLAPGFRHVAPGDVRSLEHAVDSTAAAVCLAPVDWSRGGVPFDAEYLLEVRRICDASGALLIIDETRLPAAISGHWFFHQAHGVQADIVTASAGWTGGLPGGLVFVAKSVIDRVSNQARRLGQASGQRQLASLSGRAGETGEAFSLPAAGLLAAADYPLLRAVVQATVAAVQGQGGPGQVHELAQAWADAWQDLAAGFEFVSEATTTGLWAVLQMDLPADEVAAAASKLGLRLITSGETTLLACLPVTVTVPEMERALAIFREALETIERQTIES